MCTALSKTWQAHYFGRSLDLDQSYGEKICVMPRHFPLHFRRMGKVAAHYAMIGMAVVAEGVPLYYDAVNEQGLAMAGLNFPGNAWFPPEAPDRDNVAAFEFIPWLLCQCANTEEARRLLNRLQLVDIPFGPGIPTAPLHWIVSDREASLVVESTKEGLHIYENPAGVLTNNPPFPYQMFQLNNFRGLSPATPPNAFAPDLPLEVYCQGLGALGLPGDVSSMSRFVRLVFHSANSVQEEGELACVGQFFWLLGTAEMPKGSCPIDGGYDYTVYSSCMNTELGRYYYTTYGNRQITCVDMHRTDLKSDVLSLYELVRDQRIHCQN